MFCFNNLWGQYLQILRYSVCLVLYCTAAYVYLTSKNEKHVNYFILYISCMHFSSLTSVDSSSSARDMLSTKHSCQQTTTTNYCGFTISSPSRHLWTSMKRLSNQNKLRYFLLATRKWRKTILWGRKLRRNIFHHHTVAPIHW